VSGEMKNLIIVNGTMGVGKTSTCKQLQTIIPDCVYFDGDCCWDMLPFVITEETKEMALDNIAFCLNNFLKCTMFKNIIFCWIMQDEKLIDSIVSRLNGEFKLYKFSLICSEPALQQRLLEDVRKGKRDEYTIEHSISRQKKYLMMHTIKCIRSGPHRELMTDSLLRSGTISMSSALKCRKKLLHG
jgi:hypothetical protein